MKDLFDRMRSTALSAIWSKGVKLSREGAVSLVEATDGERTFRVKEPGRTIAPTAVLYPDDGEWTCDCDVDQDPCQHVIAAVITAKEALASGELVIATGAAAPTLGYRLRRAVGPSLIVERVVDYPGGAEEPLKEPLTRLVAARRCPFEPNHQDVEVDRLLVQSGKGATRAGTSQGLSPEGYERLFAALGASKNVKLDGQPVTVDPSPLVPKGTLTDDRDAEGKAVVRLGIEWPAPGLEVLDRGVGLQGDRLRLLGATEICGPRWERLPLVRAVPLEAVADFVTKVLPEIERHLELDVRSTKLPKQGGVDAPRIHFDLSPEDGHTLSILPTLVYGDPPRVRIDGDRVVHLQGEIPKRNEAAEKALVRRLRDELELVPGRSIHFDGNDAARFAKRLQVFQSSAKTALSREVVSRVPLLGKIHTEGGRFEVTFSTDEEAPRRASVEAVYRAFRDGLDVVPLLDGGWAPLPVDWLRLYGNQIADLLAARRDDGEVPLYATPRLAELCKELGEPPPPSFVRLEPLFSNFEKIPDAGVPAEVPVALRPYQSDGVNWLTFLRDAGLGAVLADDMGLGKTLQTLCALRGKVLVVCPKSVVFNWAREIARFRPSLRVNVFHGTDRRLDDADVTLTTYAVLRLDQEALAARSWDAVVLDEAQAIKNPDSQMARAAFELTDRLSGSCFRLALSGTPVENRLDELWSIFRFTHPGLLGTRSDFDQRYARPVNTGDEQSASRMRQLIRPFLLRRLKRDVARDLPERTDVVLTVELEDEQRSLYEAVLAAKRSEVIETLEGGGSVMAALEALLRLRQAACHPRLVPGAVGTRSAKVEALLEALEDATADGHKCIVFSQWTSFLDLLEPELGEKGIGFVRLDGTTRDRAAVVEEFQRAEGPPVFLSSLKAGGTGLNLTAADHVFLLDPWWNPAAEDQAADRAHRIGQTQPVTVYRLIAKDTIEEGVLALQAKKRALYDAALEEGGAAVGLTREDLLGLLARG